MPPSMASQRVGHNWVTERQQHDTFHFHSEPSKSGVCFALTAYLSLDKPCLKCPLATYDQWLSLWAACDALVIPQMLTTRQTLKRGCTCIFLSVLRDFHYVNRKEKKEKTPPRSLSFAQVHTLGSTLDLSDSSIFNHYARRGSDFSVMKLDSYLHVRSLGWNFGNRVQWKPDVK